MRQILPPACYPRTATRHVTHTTARLFFQPPRLPPRISAPLFTRMLPCYQDRFNIEHERVAVAL